MVGEFFRSILRISRLVKCFLSNRYLIPVYYCQTVNDVLCILYFLLTCTFMLTICMCNLSHPLSGPCRCSGLQAVMYGLVMLCLT